VTPAVGLNSSALYTNIPDSDFDYDTIESTNLTRSVLYRESDAGKSKAEVSTMENFPGFPDFHQPLPNRLSANLATAYDELTQAGS